MKNQVISLTWFKITKTVKTAQITSQDLLELHLESSKAAFNSKSLFSNVLNNDTKPDAQIIHVDFVARKKVA